MDRYRATADMVADGLTKAQMIWITNGLLMNGLLIRPRLTTEWYHKSSMMFKTAEWNCPGPIHSDRWYGRWRPHDSYKEWYLQKSCMTFSICCFKEDDINHALTHERSSHMEKVCWNGRMVHALCYIINNLYYTTLSLWSDLSVTTDQFVIAYWQL